MGNSDLSQFFSERLANMLFEQGAQMCSGKFEMVHEITKFEVRVAVMRLQKCFKRNFPTRI